MMSVQNITFKRMLIRPGPASCSCRSANASTRFIMEMSEGTLRATAVGRPGTQEPGSAVVELELRPDHDGDDDGEKRHAFNEGRQDQRASLNRARHLRLPGHAFRCRAADATDADSRADRREAGA